MCLTRICNVGPQYIVGGGVVYSMDWQWQKINDEWNYVRKCRPEDTIPSAIVGLMLGQPRRRWTNIK